MKKVEESAIKITSQGIVVTHNENTAAVIRHTEEIEEIITKVPSWVVRWGITLFFAILLIVLAISVLVRYPDMVEVPIKIEASSAATPVLNPIPGRITQVFVKKNQIINKGQPLVQLESLTSGETYTLKATRTGKVSFAAIVQQGSQLQSNQPVLLIHPANEEYFGVVNIPSKSISKIKEGQDVLVNFNNYPSGQYDPLKAKIDYIADEPSNNGFFIAKVAFISTPNTHLKNWMTGSAKIVTEEVSLQSRIYNNIIKGIN